MTEGAITGTAPKRLLMVAYYFEPQSSVGVFRTVRLAKHLLAQGWHIDIITVANPDPQFEPLRAPLPTDLVHHEHVQVHNVKAWPVKPLWQVPTAIASRLAKWVGATIDDGQIAGKLWHIDMQWGFARALPGPVMRLMRNRKFDAVYVSCPPFSSAAPAIESATRFDVPAVLDFRDSWVVSPYASAATKKYDGLEKSLLHRASALIVNTQADLESYASRVGEEKLHWLPNGFDLPMQGPFELGTSDTLRLSYLGAWDDGPRNPRPLLRALKRAGWKWHLSNYANDHGALQRAAGELGVEPQISYHDFVPKTQIGNVIEASDALILVQGHSADKAAPVTHVAAKTFDYLATGRMVLGLVANGANKDLLEQYADHAIIAAPDDDTSIQQALTQLHAAWQNDELPRNPDQRFLDVYSEQALGSRFENILLAVINRHSAK